MAKKYNICSKSDMRRLQRDINRDLKRAINTATYQYTCHACGRTYKATVDHNYCPYCRSKFILRLAR